MLSTGLVQGGCPRCLTLRSCTASSTSPQRLQRRNCGSSTVFAGASRSAPLGQHRNSKLCARAAAAAAPTQEKVQLDVTKMAPLGDRLLVKPDEAKNVTAGGLLLSAGTTSPVQEAVVGKVLGVGEDVDLAVKAGDQVIFSKYSSTDVKVPDGEVCFVAKKSILAVLS